MVAVDSNLGQDSRMVSGRQTTQPQPVASRSGASSTSAHPAAEIDRRICVYDESKLMLVDDEQINIRIVEKHLRGIGYSRFVSTTNPTEALQMLRDEQPDLVLLDIMMPQLNGLDLLREIRADARFQRLPVVILTACFEPATKREALEEGATDFLAKPVDAHELALRVRNVLYMKAHQDYLEELTDQLEGEVRRQAEALALARHEAEMRYLAGKAEIASDVLHNVGNALNSVNTGVSLIEYSLRDSQLASLKLAADLLREHSDDLISFLANDPRGRVLPMYLVELSEELLGERDRMIDETALLSKHVAHVKAVVATQQEYAALCNVNEDVPLRELMTDVNSLFGDSLVKAGVAFEYEGEENLTVRSDRQKMLQIMLNLVKNALESINQVQKRGQGRLHIRCGRRDEERAFIEVRDNGLGIRQSDLSAVFAHGFTTKAGGHGFGLHSCANIIKELGGSIQVHSDGPGSGATFTLEIPFRKQGN